MLRSLPGKPNAISEQPSRPRRGARISAETLLDSLYHAVISTDREGTILSWNRAAEKLYGLPAAAAIGQPLPEVMPKGTPLADPSGFFETALADGRWSGMYKPESDGLVLLTIAPIGDRDSDEAGFVITSRQLEGIDLPHMVNESERLRLENRLLQAERISSLGRLAASVAHEFNNVLMGIQPFIDLLIRRAGSDPAVKLAAPRIADAVARGKRITQEILRFTRITEPARVPVNVSEWLHAFGPEMEQLAGPNVKVI